MLFGMNQDIIGLCEIIHEINFLSGLLTPPPNVLYVQVCHSGVCEGLKLTPPNLSWPQNLGNLLKNGHNSSIFHTDHMNKNIKLYSFLTVTSKTHTQSPNYLQCSYRHGNSHRASLTAMSVSHTHTHTHRIGQLWHHHQLCDHVTSLLSCILGNYNFLICV